MINGCHDGQCQEKQISKLLNIAEKLLKMAIEMSSDELKDLFMNLYKEENVSLRAELFPTVPNMKNFSAPCPSL